MPAKKSTAALAEEAPEAPEQQPAAPDEAPEQQPEAPEETSESGVEPGTSGYYTGAVPVVAPAPWAAELGTVTPRPTWPL